MRNFIPQSPLHAFVLVLATSSAAFAAPGQEDGQQRSLTERLDRLRVLEEDLPESARAEYLSRRAVVRLDPGLSLSLSGIRGAGPRQGDGWTLVIQGRQTRVEQPAAQLYRSQEIEAYEHSVGPAGIWAGLSIMALAAAEAREPIAESLPRD